MCDKNHSSRVTTQPVAMKEAVILLTRIEDMNPLQTSSSTNDAEVLNGSVPHTTVIKQGEFPGEIYFSSIKDEPEEASEETGMPQCTLCSEECMDKKSLKVHERSHCGDRIFTCKSSNKTFYLSSSLNLHRLLTTECSNNVEHM